MLVMNEAVKCVKLQRRNGCSPPHLPISLIVLWLFEACCVGVFLLRSIWKPYSVNLHSDGFHLQKTNTCSRSSARNVTFSYWRIRNRKPMATKGLSTLWKREVTWLDMKDGIWENALLKPSVVFVHTMHFHSLCLSPSLPDFRAFIYLYLASWPFINSTSIFFFVLLLRKLDLHAVSFRERLTS